MEANKIELEYLQKIADFLLSLEEATYVLIAAFAKDPKIFIAACKLASETYYIDITFTPDYTKVKRERTWKNSFIN